MTGDFVDRLVAHVRPEVKQIGAHTYTVSSAGARLVESPLPKPLEARSLSAIVDFLGSRKDLFVHVESPTVVSVLSEMNLDQRRACFMTATFAPPLGNFFGAYHDAEPFVIALMSTFHPTDDLPGVLKIAGTLESEAVVNLDDDGVSQKATVRQGIARKAEAMIHNPVMLAPFRTFAEIVQPVSAFILRLKGGGENHPPECALIVADGGAWALNAMAMIKAWLAEKLPDVQIIA